jgi:hypothetical protein
MICNLDMNNKIKKSLKNQVLHHKSVSVGMNTEWQNQTGLSMQQNVVEEHYFVLPLRGYHHKPGNHPAELRSVVI